MPYPSPANYPAALLTPPPGTTAGTIVSVGNLVLGVTDANGSSWTLMDFEGWTGSPDSTLELTQRSRADGATTNEAFLGARHLVLSGLVAAPTAQALNASLAALNTAVTLAPFQLSVNESGTVLAVMAQRNGPILTPKINSRFARFSIQIVAKDPLKYGASATYTTPLPSTTGGVTYPVTYPLTYTGVTNSGVIHVNNPGNAPAPVLLRIDGVIPAGGWSVNHLGQALTLSFATSLSLNSGEFVTVDMQRREVLAQGQSTRNGYVTSRGWFQLDPGPNDIAFSSVAYDPTALLTLTTYPAWS